MAKRTYIDVLSASHKETDEKKKQKRGPTFTKHLAFGNLFHL